MRWDEEMGGLYQVLDGLPPNQVRWDGMRCGEIRWDERQRHQALDQLHQRRVIWHDMTWDEMVKRDEMRTYEIIWDHIKSYYIRRGDGTGDSFIIIIGWIWDRKDGIGWDEWGDLMRMRFFSLTRTLLCTRIKLESWRLFLAISSFGWDHHNDKWKLWQTS